MSDFTDYTQARKLSVVKSAEAQAARIEHVPLERVLAKNPSMTGILSKFALGASLLTYLGLCDRYGFQHADDVLVGTVQEWSTGKSILHRRTVGEARGLYSRDHGLPRLSSADEEAFMRELGVVSTPSRPAAEPEVSWNAVFKYIDGHKK